jgi:TP901-1 family phage major tail protein
MAVQRGKDLLIKMDMSGDGLFETVAGLRATRLSFNAETVDVTSLNSPGGWRELLAGAGVKAASLSGSGVFRDAATDERARAIFFAGEIPDFQVVIPDFGTVEGPFQITSLEFAGSYNGEATYELSMASAGQLAFTAFTPGAPDPTDSIGDGSDQPPPIDDTVPGPGEGDA